MLIGVFTSILMEVIGVPALAFAVGMYLPLESTTPVFLGGLARHFVDWKRGSESESDAGPGVLYSSGLVAGGSIMGLVASFLNWPVPRVAAIASKLGFGALFGGKLGPWFGAEGNLFAGWIGFLAFLGVAYMIYRTATRNQDTDAPTH